MGPAISESFDLDFMLPPDIASIDSDISISIFLPFFRQAGGFDPNSSSTVQSPWNGLCTHDGPIPISRVRFQPQAEAAPSCAVQQLGLRRRDAQPLRLPTEPHPEHRGGQSVRRRWEPL